MPVTRSAKRISPAHESAQPAKKIKTAPKDKSGTDAITDLADKPRQAVEIEPDTLVLEIVGVQCTNKTVLHLQPPKPKTQLPLIPQVTIPQPTISHVRTRSLTNDLKRKATDEIESPHDEDEDKESGAPRVKRLKLVKLAVILESDEDVTEDLNAIMLDGQQTETHFERKLTRTEKIVAEQLDRLLNLQMRTKRLLRKEPNVERNRLVLADLECAMEMLLINGP